MKKPAENASEQNASEPDRRALRRSWAQLIRLIYEVDPLVCPRCGGLMRIIAFITELRVIGKILKHLAAKGVDARSPPGADPSSPRRTVTAACLPRLAPRAPPGSCLSNSIRTRSDRPSPRRSALRSSPSVPHRYLDNTSFTPYHACSEKGNSYP